MASNPPSDVMEDHTDEDFFDKLVDDDFGGATGSGSAGETKLSEAGGDSDEAKAFANLGIEDAKNEDESPAGSATDDVSGRANDVASDTLNSVGSESPTENNESGEIGSEVVLASVDRQGNADVGSGKSGVKEVGWSSFYADSLQNGNQAFGSYSDFFSELADSTEEFAGKPVAQSGNAGGEVSGGLDQSGNAAGKGGGGLDNSVSYNQYQDGNQAYGGGSGADSGTGQDMSSSQYWENMYPGWKYDESTGQWYQVEHYNVAAIPKQGNVDANSGRGWVAGSADGKMEVNYLQQTSQSVVRTAAETSTTESVSSWNQVSPGNNNGYPEHMVFDPQYPGWYYDTITQQWLSLESYSSSALPTTLQSYDQRKENGLAFSGSYSHNSNTFSGYGSQSYSSQGQNVSWGQSYGGYNQSGVNMWQPGTGSQNDSSFGGNKQTENSFGSNFSMNNVVDEHKSFSSSGQVPLYEYEKASQGHAEANGSQGFVPSGNLGHQFNQGNVKPNEQIAFSSALYSSQNPVSVSQQLFQANEQLSYAHNTKRSSAGRPVHALVTFGFGGKLIVVKNNSYVGIGSQDPVGGSISVLNLMEVVSGGTDNILCGGTASGYFQALCHQSFPGPLVGGNVGSKELNKWVDERIANCQSPDMNYRNGEILKLLLSLLKIACHHYGKLRSPFGTDSSLMDSNAPETDVAKLFASAKKSGTQFGEYGALNRCLQNLPSEGQMRATASEVQNLLISGRKKEALQCAQEGQLWGPALVLASQLGDQFYVDTVKLMALRQLVAGSPLRTLCLLIAGQPADVFSTEIRASGAFIASQQPLQSGTSGMLDDWEENLAVITANRTKGDEFVLMHLGDCLWKDRSEVTAAHICYLIAEAKFDPYSDTARMCLIGGDHWKHPRTYASPEAIQRTELYEYAKLLGNSQFSLQPFLPYKLIYAYMLAEVGKVSDSLKYCQAVLRSLKTGRASDAETWKQLVQSLEDRIRAHQQGGYSNSAPAKFVGKLLNVFDSTARRVVGGLPPPVPLTSHGSAQSHEYHHPEIGTRVSTSQSTMAMSSLAPSNSMEPISDWAADKTRMSMHNRSVSEPNIGRIPRQDYVDHPKDETSTSVSGKASTTSTGASRFGRFGFGSQLLQKTMGLVMRPRADKQAKLGEKNKFYYDEKLKRWVEEGAEPPAEDAALPPPPTTLGFQNGTPDYNLKSASKGDGSPTNDSPTFKTKTPTPAEHTSGIPPIPTSSNQFSARGRTGVRSRYVDTFNQGGGSSGKLFQSPGVPSVKPANTNAKFFVPSPALSGSHSMDSIAENVQQDPASSENSYPSTMNDSSNLIASRTPVVIQRFPSMDNMTRKGVVTDGNGTADGNGTVPCSRRTASWGGSFGDPISAPEVLEANGPKPLGEVLGMSPAAYMSSEPPANLPIDGGSLGDDLHEVEL